LLRGTSWQALGQFAPLIINLLLTPYIIAGLGKEIYAIFLLVSTIQLFMGAFDGGIGPSANRYFTVYAGRGDTVATTRLLTTLLAIVGAVMLLVFGAFFAFTPQIVAFFDVMDPDPEGSIFLLRTMVVLVALAQARGLFAYVLFAQHKFSVTTITGLVGHVIYTAGLVWSVETHQGLRGIAYTFVLQQAVATALIIPPAWRYLNHRGIAFVSGDVLKDFFGYSWKVQLSSLMDLTAMQGDHLIVGKLAAGQYAFFGPGANFAQQLRMVPMNAFSPLQAMLGRAVGAVGGEGARAEYERLQRLWVIGVVGWVVCAAPAAYFAVSRWLNLSEVKGGQMSDLPGLSASVLLIGHLFYLIAVIQVIWCLSLGHSELELRYGIVGLVLNLVGTIALIIPFGVLGSIVATAVSQLVAALALTWMMRRKLSVQTSSPWRAVPYDVALLAAALSYLGAWGMSLLVGDLRGALALVACGAGAIPALIVYVALALDHKELRRVLKR